MDNSSSGERPGYVEYLKSISKKRNETHKKLGEVKELSNADSFTMEATHKFPDSFLEDLGKTNASSTGYLPPYGTPPPLYFPEPLTAGGYTYSNGHPLAGQVVLAGNRKGTRQVNTFGHENFHARAKAEGEFGFRNTSSSLGPVPVGAIGDENFRELRKRMSQVADPSKDTSKWGLQPGRSAEELFANLVGYESALPKGTNILDSEVGKQLFYTDGKIDPKLRDYYFTHSSIPYGGIWEGQAPEESKLEAFTRKLKKKLRF